MVLGNFVATARKRLGITQEDLATQARLDRSHISRIEGNKAGSLRLSTLEKIAAVLGLTVTDMLRGRLPRQRKSADRRPRKSKAARLSDELRAYVCGEPHTRARREELGAELGMHPNSIARIQQQARKRTVQP